MILDNNFKLVFNWGMKSTENNKEPNIVRDDKGRFCSKGNEDCKKQKKEKKDFLIMTILTF